MRPLDVSVNSKAAWHPLLCRWYVQTENSSLHASAEWLLRTWQLDIPAVSDHDGSPKDRGWTINSAGITLVKVPLGSFERRCGHNSARVDRPQFLTAPFQTVTCTNTVLVSDREISVAQFDLLRKDADYDPREKAERWRGKDALQSPTSHHPAQNVNWIDAVKYCNWLSHQEGLPPACERSGQTSKFPAAGTTPGIFEEWSPIEGSTGFQLKPSGST